MNDTSPPDETRSAIEAFEQILDAFPDDLSTLEALYQAYETLGDSGRARQYVLRAARAAEAQGATAVPPTLTERLGLLAENDPEAARLLKALSTRPGAAPGGAPAGEKEARGRPRETRQRPIEAEMAFAWKLKEAGLLPEAEYARLVQDLTESSANDHSDTLSLLHVMQDRAIRNLEEILAFASRDTGMAILPLSSFEPHPEAMALLPPDFMIRQGAIAFDTLGPEVLVATLNPYHTALQEEIRRLCGRPCHFYLTTPQEFDAMAKRFREPASPGAKRPA